MNEQQWTEYINDLYDKEVLAAGTDGVKRTEVIQNLTPKVAEALKNGDVELPDVEKMIADTIGRTDNERNRKRRFADLLPLLTGNREDETILDVDFDPWMQQAWSIGDGIRRAGKYLSIPDGDAIMANKRKHVTAAAAVYETEASAWDDIKAIMRAGNHAHLGELA